MCGLLHAVPMLFEEEYVSAQRLDLVINPEDGLGTGHGPRRLGSRSGRPARARQHVEDTPFPAAAAVPGPGSPQILHSLANLHMGANPLRQDAWRRGRRPETVTDHLAAVEDRILADMADAGRGPRRNGLFALWLFVRHCDGALPPAPLSARASAERLDGLERRLSSLTLPAALRRALPASVRELRSDHGDRVALALQQLSAPAREAVGSTSADALLLAARAARRASRSAESGTRAP